MYQYVKVRFDDVLALGGGVDYRLRLRRLWFVGWGVCRLWFGCWCDMTNSTISSGEASGSMKWTAGEVHRGGGVGTGQVGLVS